MGLAELLRPRNREQVVARMLGSLATGQGGAAPNTFGATSYLPGGALRTLLEIQGEAQADTERLVSQLAAGGYLETAAGEWLDAYVASQYDLRRGQSTFAEGNITVRCVALAGPYELMAGELIVSTGDGLRYTSTAGATVPAGGAVLVPIRAEQPGSAYNVTNFAITTLNTPQPGMSVTNQPGWMLTPGNEAENDTQLRLRARLRWAERGGGATRAAYEFWALSSTPSINSVRVLDQNPRGQGTVDVVVWGTGGIGPVAIAAADAYIQARRPVTADVRVYGASETIQVLALILFAPGQDRPRIEAEILANLAVLQRITPIGGTLYRSAVIEAAMLPAGMVDVRLPDYVVDLVLTSTGALTLNPTLTWRV